MRRRQTAVLLLSTALGGCSLFRRRVALPPTAAHYTLGEPYQLAGIWYYPADKTEYTEMGLATVATDTIGLTADGERFDPTALAASHRTLQLPAIARVTNLENGRQVLVRLNDRGPENPGRLVGLTRRAAELLQANDGTQIRVELDAEMTRALTEQVGGGPKLAVAAAPLADVKAEDLPPPPGSEQASRIRSTTGVSRTSRAEAAVAVVPDRLPEQITQTNPAPGLIYLQASEFGRIDYAYQQAAKLAGLSSQVQRLRDGRTERYRVVAGPFITVAAADAALDQALRAGVIDSRLVVEQE